MTQYTSRDIIGFTLLIIVAFFLRIYGIDFPTYHWDEKLDFNNVFAASFYNLELNTYVHGSLHVYLLLSIWKIYLFFNGVSPNTENILLAFFQDPKPLLILARGWIALISTTSILLIFLLGKSLYHKRIGWLATIVLAGTFLHIAESHYARTHVLASFFVILVLYFCKRILENGNQYDYLFAGISLGLATASQYSVALTILPILYVHIMYVKKSAPDANIIQYLINRNLLLCINISAISFFIATPYALINFPRFSAEIKFVLRDVTRLWVDAEGKPIWLFFLTEHLPNGIGFLLTMISIIGIVYAFVRHQQEDIMLIIFIVASFVTLAKSANFARYLIPSLPILVIFVALILDKIFIFLESKLSQFKVNTIFILILVVIMFPSLMNSLRFDYWFTQTDTRQLASEWVLVNLPRGSAIVIEGAEVLGPPVPILKNEIENWLSPQHQGTFIQTYMSALLDSRPLERGYNVLSVFRLDEQHERGSFIKHIEDASYYKDLGYQYLITSSWMQRHSNNTYSSNFEDSLYEYYQPIKAFEPSIYFLFDPYCWRIDYTALKQVIPGNPVISGPILMIYKIKESE